MVLANDGVAPFVIALSNFLHALCLPFYYISQCAEFHLSCWCVQSMPGIRLYGLEQGLWQARLARLLGGRACKALQDNCKAPQGSAGGNCQGILRYQALGIIYMSSLMLHSSGEIDSMESVESANNLSQQHFFGRLNDLCTEFCLSPCFFYEKASFQWQCDWIASRGLSQSQ